MAADDVASAVSRVAIGLAVNKTIEVGGPQRFRLDELVRRALAARNDPRQVVTDPGSRYYGIRVSERTLLPGSDARLGETHFEDWLSHSAPAVPAVSLTPWVRLT
jgi:uncharacterized protein YbjT (DUF2867 family)